MKTTFSQAQWELSWLLADITSNRITAVIHNRRLRLVLLRDVNVDLDLEKLSPELSW